MQDIKMNSQNGHYDNDHANYETRQGLGTNNNTTVIAESRGSNFQESSSGDIKLLNTSILDLGANKHYKTKVI